MKLWVLLIAATCTLFFSCWLRKAPEEIHVTADSTVVNDVPTLKDGNFFPVTGYIKGQINSIKSGNINPLQVVIEGGKTDSSWLKPDQLEKNLGEFLTPAIDTANLKTLFKQNSFLDQTINAFTFTYDPIATLPDSMELRHWDVYVDPEKFNISKIYLIKNKDSGKRQLQLTWRNNQSAKILSILNKPDGSRTVEKETTITWNF